MSCEQTRAQLRAQFDIGAPLGNGTMPHLAQCTACRAYCDRLVALQDTLGNLPLEHPTPGFTRVVRAAVAQSARGDAARRRAWAGMAAAVAVAMLVGGWLYPLPLDLPALTAAAAKELAGIEIPTWRELGQSAAALATSCLDELRSMLVTEGSALWRQVQASLAWREGLSPLILWGTLAASLFILGAVNGAEWWRLRTTTGAYSRPHGRSVR